MIYGLVYYPNDASRVFGYVRYVLPNSDAAQQEVVRGMIFSSVDGVQLSDTNYTDLLDTDSYTLSWATYDGITVSPTGATTSLVKTQQTQNPIQLRQVLEINGQKIGYLMYNAFTNEFDQALNNVFADFAAQGISDLVLDLRYNGGGSVKTATYLSGMITGQFNGQIFYNEQWNSDRQQVYASPGLFVNQMDNGTALNTLGLNRVYVLTSPSTASASELVINGLTPYIEVVQIGTATRGKFQASFLLYDAPAPSFTRSLANTGHRYAMLPLVFKTLNAAGVTDYADGLVPDIELSESFDNLGMLGTLSEPLLAQAIAEITGIPQPQQRTSSAREYTRTDDPWNALMYR
jgi:carboxyl-terminal processing protease